MPAQFSRGILVIAIMAVSSFLSAADEPPAGVTATFKGHTEALYAVAFSPDGKLIATGSFDKTVRLWNPSGKEIRTLNGPAGHQNLVLAVAFSRNGQWLASGSSDNSAKIWDVSSSSPLREFAFADPVQALAMSQ